MAHKIYAVRDISNSMYVPVLQHKSGGLCPFYIIEDPLALRYATLRTMRNDLEECLGGIDYLELTKGQSSAVRAFVLFGVIFRYAKCFTENDGGPQLNEKDVFRGVKPEILAWHKETMNIRNKYLAHRTKSEHEDFGMVLYLDPDTNTKRFVRDEYACVKMDNDDSNLSNYIELFKAVINYIDVTIQNLIPNYQKLIANLDKDIVYNDAEFPNPNEVVEFNGMGA